MVKALLLKTDGTTKRVSVRTPSDYRRCLGGNTEMLATRSNAVCYVRQSPHKDVTIVANPFTALLAILGFDVDSVRGTHSVMGDALLCGSMHELDTDVPQYVNDMIAAYLRAKDRDLFLLEMDNRAPRYADGDDETSASED